VFVGKGDAIDPWGATKPQHFSCERSFSFFRLVEAISREAPSAEWVLHRLANLLRKFERQHPKCRLSCRLDRAPTGLPIFELEDKQLSRVLKRPVKSECLILSFFAAAVLDEKAFRDVPDDQLLIHCLVKRIGGLTDPSGNVYEAFVRPQLLLNNFLNGVREHSVQIGGRRFRMQAVYFSQQNGRSAKCAQSAMSMALRAMGLRLRDGSEPTPAEINKLVPVALGRGLKLHEMVRVFRDVGLSPLAVDFTKTQAIGVDYRSLVHAGVESGVPVLLCFVTRGRQSRKLETHVVTIFGHTLNTDTWVAEAEFGYGVAADYKYHASLHWCTHWIISDDNLGVFFCLQANRLTSVWDVFALQPSSDSCGQRLRDWILRLPRRRYVAGQLREFNVAAVVVPLPKASNVDIRSAEINTLGHLQHFAEELRALMPEGTFTEAWWIERLVRRLTAGHPGPGPILRTRQIGRDAYIAHLRPPGGADWEQRCLQPGLITRLEKELPELFWMTEYTLVDLFTANRRKLGEVLWQPRWSQARDMSKGLLLTRFPGLLKIHPCNSCIPTGCWSHVPMLSTAMQGDQF